MSVCVCVCECVVCVCVVFSALAGGGVGREEAC